jgi:hypothetical protein
MYIVAKYNLGAYYPTPWAFPTLEHAQGWISAHSLSSPAYVVVYLDMRRAA